MERNTPPTAPRARRAGKASAAIAAAGLLLGLAAPAALLASCGGDSTTTSTTAVATSTTAAPTPLADGEHFGFVRDLGAGAITLDPAEFLTGERAVAAAREDGAIGESEDLPNDFYIRNADPATVQLTVDAAGTFTLIGLDAAGALTDVPVTFEELARYWNGDDDTADLYGFVVGNVPLNVTVSGGSVSEGAQQYLP